MREGKREREKDFPFDIDISRGNCHLVIYISATRGATAADINSLAGDFGGLACPNLSENRSRGNSGRDMGEGGGTSWLCLVGGINHPSI